jgi:Domain of unknown function (DUF4386)
MWEQSPGSGRTIMSMSEINQGQRQIGAEVVTQSQRAWARVAGLMYWMVLIVDLTGLQLHAPIGRWLMLSGSLLTVPLAFGLYFAVRPAGEILAMSAAGFRLLEATLGVISTAIGFGVVEAELAASTSGTAVLRFVQWNDATALGAFVFTIGSTIFFYLFVQSGYIPRVLAWLGLLASLVAMAACLIHFARPSFPAMTMYAWIPMLLAETSTGTWLLVKSVKQHGTHSRQSSRV